MPYVSLSGLEMFVFDVGYDSDSMNVCVCVVVVEAGGLPMC